MVGSNMEPRSPLYTISWIFCMIPSSWRKVPAKGHMYPCSDSRKCLRNHEVILLHSSCSLLPEVAQLGLGQGVSRLRVHTILRIQGKAAGSSILTLHASGGETQTVSRLWKMSRLSPGARQDPPPAALPSNQSQLSAGQ